MLSRLAPIHMQLMATLAFAALLTGALAVATAVAGAAHPCQRVIIASSSEKSGMLGDFASSYNRVGRSVGGACVRVTVREVKSGDAERALETGWGGRPSETPDVWSPASRAWVVLLAQRSPSGAALLPVGYDSLFQSPLVLGMPEPMAAALGYPGKPLGWSDIFALAGDHGGWGSVGHPEWGPFKIGKTNPTVSTSGLHALIGTYFAAGGGLSVDGIAAEPVRAFVAGVEAGVVHYGETSADFLRNLQDADDRGSALQYISAIALEEKELADYNAGVVSGVRHAVPRVALVPIYPKDGTPIADHAYVVLKSSPNQPAARDFYEFLKEPGQQATIDSNGFRDRFGRSGEALRGRRFLNPAQPSLVLQPPPGAVLEAMISGWQAVRKRARVLILVDAAVEGRSLAQATARLGEALSGLQSRDEVGVWVFPAAAAPYGAVSQLGPMAAGGDRLRRALSAVGATRRPAELDEALRGAVASLSASYDPAAVDAVLLVDVSQERVRPADETLERDIRNQETTRFVRVFTVGPRGQRLEGIALAGRGASYQPGSTADFFNQVISNF